MTLARRFEDMPSWQEARKLAGQIYRLIATASFAGDASLGERLWRAALSSMVHIAEGPICASNAQVTQCLQLARRSVAEVQSLLYIALDVGCISADLFRTHYEQAARVAALVGEVERSLVERNN